VKSCLYVDQSQEAKDNLYKDNLGGAPWAIWSFNLRIACDPFGVKTMSDSVYGRYVQMYSQMPDLTSISNPDFAGTSKSWPAE